MAPAEAQSLRILVGYFPPPRRESRSRRAEASLASKTQEVERDAYLDTSRPTAGRST